MAIDLNTAKPGLTGTQTPTAAETTAAPQDPVQAAESALRHQLAHRLAVKQAFEGARNQDGMATIDGLLAKLALLNGGSRAVTQGTAAVAQRGAKEQTPRADRIDTPSKTAAVGSIDQLMGRLALSEGTRPPGGPKRLDANPYALSPSTLKRIATDPKAGPVLPPPAAHVKPINGPQAAAFAKRAAMYAPAVGAGAAGSAITPQAMQSLMTDPSPQALTVTPHQASEIKSLVGTAPPKALVAQEPSAPTSSPTASGGNTTDNLYGSAKSSDSLADLKARATRFVAWGQFYIGLTAKQQQVLATWMLKQHKLQTLAATVAIDMAKDAVLLQKNLIAIDHATTMLGLLAAVQAARSQPVQQMSRPLYNQQRTNEEMDIDLGAAINLHPERAYNDNLQRKAFIRRLDGRAAEHDAALNRFTAPTAPVQGAHGVSLLDVPTGGPQGAMQPMDRTMLSQHELAALSPEIRQTYQQARAELIAHSHDDIGMRAMLYRDEIMKCEAAAQVWGQHAARPGLDPADAAHARTAQEQWNLRAASLKEEATPIIVEHQRTADAVMHEENSYGNLLRQRRDLEEKRAKMKTEVAATQDPALREQLEERLKVATWRAISLDTELGKHTNVREDFRSKRWHTGAPDMTDGFVRAFDEARGAPGADPHLAQVRLETLRATAPVGALQINDLYIKSVRALAAGEAPNITRQDVQGVHRDLMLRHIRDRQEALKHPPREGLPPSVTAFHRQETEHLAAAEAYWRNRAPFEPARDAARPANLAFGLSADQLLPPVLRKKFEPTKDVPDPMTPQFTQAPDPSVLLDPAKARAYYDARADAGASVTGRALIPELASYRNPMFEKLNTWGNWANNVANANNGLSNTLDNEVAGDVDNVSGDASSTLSELYSQMAQDRNGIHGLINQVVDQIHHVPT